MPETELNILLDTEFKGKGLEDLKREFKENRDRLEELTKTGRRSTEDFKRLQEQQKRTGDAVKGLTREYKGLDAQVKASKYQMMEYRENLTIVAAGAVLAAKQIVNLGKQLYSTSKQGAEFRVLYNQFEDLAGGIGQAQKQIELLRKASTGNLPDEELIKFSNEMAALGYSTETTIKTLDIAERKGDEVGVGFEAANDALQKFITTGSGRGLLSLGINVGVVSKKMEELTGHTMEQIGELTDLEQQQIRTDAIMSLYGDTLDNISKKTGDNADQISSLASRYDNLTNIVGVGLSSAFVSLASGIDTSDAKLGTAIANAVEYGKLAASIIRSIGDLSMNPALMGDEWHPLEFLDAIEEARKNIKINNDLSLGTYGPENRYGPENKPADYNWKKDKTGSRSGSKSKNTKDPLDELIQAQQTLVEIEDIQNRFSTLALHNALVLLRANEGLVQTDAQRLAYLEAITGWQEKIKEKIGISGGAVALGRSSIESVLLGEGMNGAGKEVADEYLKNRAESIERMDQSMQGLLQTTSEWFSLIASGDGAEDGFKNFMKGIVNTFITSIQAMILASAAAMSGKAISTFGLSLITDAPLLAAAWASLELAKGTIGGLATGGHASAGTPYIVGEEGQELFVPSTPGYVFNHQDMKSMMRSMNPGNSTNNIYIGADVDHIKFKKVSDAKARKNINLRLLD